MNLPGGGLVFKTRHQQQIAMKLIMSVDSVMRDNEEILKILRRTPRPSSRARNSAGSC